MSKQVCRNEESAAGWKSSAEGKLSPSPLRYFSSGSPICNCQEKNKKISQHLHIKLVLVRKLKKKDYFKMANIFKKRSVQVARRFCRKAGLRRPALERPCENQRWSFMHCNIGWKQTNKQKIQRVQVPCLGAWWLEELWRLHFKRAR